MESHFLELADQFKAWNEMPFHLLPTPDEQVVGKAGWKQETWVFVLARCQQLTLGKSIQIPFFTCKMSCIKA